MAFIHGKSTVITLDGDDLSAYTNTSELTLTADSHDVTTYGKNSHVFSGGLKGGTATMGGIYDSTASTGPRAVIKPLIGTVVELIRKPEGTGSGKPTDTVDVLLTQYVETNPVADMVTWSCEMTLSDDVASTTQGA
ncbi:hypothetical protein F8280_12115 [Micromonospora noduli]|uniref:hypothetical protein n=1 Tax=Micromonospora noduli TaxID=709876 RepID=UPI00124B8307|nr:hypothetical protein [Micromonospora noduli]KAB1925148.1 hypothetical protein F8280_12115 [Micromonospora noduli]